MILGKGVGAPPLQQGENSAERRGPVTAVTLEGGRVPPPVRRRVPWDPEIADR